MTVLGYTKCSEIVRNETGCIAGVQASMILEPVNFNLYSKNISKVMVIRNKYVLFYYT
jgi:hypothetical protein